MIVLIDLLAELLDLISVRTVRLRDVNAGYHQVKEQDYREENRPAVNEDWEPIYQLIQCWSPIRL